MENASKALIIAGAILLSILIIALGVLVYNQAQNAVSNASMDSNKIATYNAEFDKYLGTKVKGEMVKSLLKIMKNHNLGNSSDSSLFVTLNGTTGDLTTVNGAITGFTVNDGKIYSVVADYDDNTGFIYNIKITANS